jgi:hypothetical protein
MQGSKLVILDGGMVAASARRLEDASHSIATAVE